MLAVQQHTAKLSAFLAGWIPSAIRFFFMVADREFLKFQLGLLSNLKMKKV